MKKILLLFGVFVSFIAHAQDTTNVDSKTKPDDDKINTLVEIMPEYPGGQEALMKYFKKNIKYTKEARRKGVEGRVLISFIVDKDGSIDSARVIKGIGYGCDEVALEAVKNMPLWKPGVQDGRNVRVHFTLPILFKMPD
jgi:periplasmic protein TonB